MKKFLLAAVAVLLAVSPATLDASVNTYGFYKLTNNNVENLSSQLFVDVWDASQANSATFTNFYAGLGGFDPVIPIDIGTGVLFIIRNNVGIASNVAEVYFDDGTILAQSGVYNGISGSTAFTGGSANPGNLPGGNDASPPFVATGAFSADITNTGNGINANSDLLGLSYTLQGMQDYDDVLAAFASGDLRVGLHIRSIGVAGGSDGYINRGQIPEPASILCWSLLAIGGVSFVRRRKIA